MSSHPSPISTLKLRVTQGLNVFEDPVSSSTLGPNNLQITSQSFPVIFNAFNNHPPGTIFSPSVVANYATGSFATDYVLSIPSVPANFVPKKITPTLSLGGIPNTVTSTDDPFSLTVTSASNGVLTYSSSVPGVATINSSGLVTPVSAGTTTITVNQAASADGVYAAATASIELVVSVPPPSPTSMLVANYPFDSDGNDVSTNDNHLTNHNTVTFNTVNFKQGTGAAEFNGSNYFEIANDGRFSPDNFTIACWIKPVNSEGNYQSIATCRSGFSPNVLGWMIYIAPDNSLQFWTGNYPSWSGPGIHLYSGFGTLNAWVHIAFTFTKSTGSLAVYINGTLTTTVSRSYANNTTTTLRIGAGATESSAQFFLKNNTLLDDFQFYDATLSASQINDIYTS